MNIVISLVCCAFFLALGAWSAPQDDLSCSNNADCGLIPISGCLGCANGEGHWAVNKIAAKRIMGSKQNQCLAELKAFKDPQENMKAHESCEQINAANCENGLCVGVFLSKEKLEQRMNKSKKIGD